MINCFPSITSRSTWDISQLILGLTSWKIWTLFRLHLPGSLNTREFLVLRSREASGSGSSRWRSMSEFHSLSFHGNIVCHHSVSTHISTVYDTQCIQEIFPTQGSNPSLLCLLHCGQILYLVSHLMLLKSNFEKTKNNKKELLEISGNLWGEVIASIQEIGENTE